MLIECDMKIGGIDSGNALMTADFKPNLFTADCVGIGSITNHPVVFGVNNAEVARLTVIGMGLGTASPQTRFHMSGAAQTSAAQTSLRISDTSNSGSRDWLIGNASGPNYGHLYFHVGASQNSDPLIGKVVLDLTSSGLEVRDGAYSFYTTANAFNASAAQITASASSGAWNDSYVVLQLHTGNTSAFTNDFTFKRGCLILDAVDGAGIGFYGSSPNSNYGIYMASYSYGAGGRLDSSSDYNLYFKMVAGTNRGFVFNNGAGPVAQIDGGGNIYGTLIRSTAGSASTPDHSWQGDPDTGFYNYGANQVGVACGATAVARFNASGFSPITTATFSLGGGSFKWAQIHGGDIYGRMLHDAGSTSASTAPAMFTSGALMTAAEAGAREYDGKCHWVTFDNLNRNGIDVTLFTNNTTTTNNSASATSLIPAGVGSATIKGGHAAVGKTYELTLRGYFGTASTPTMQFVFKLGSTTIVTTSNSAILAASSKGWQLNLMFMFDTIGASGKVWVQGEWLCLDGGLQAIMFTTTSHATIDTTADMLVDVISTWGSFVSGDSMVTTNALLRERH